jgi:hypothetical protein
MVWNPGPTLMKVMSGTYGGVLSHSCDFRWNAPRLPLQRHLKSSLYYAIKGVHAASCKVVSSTAQITASFHAAMNMVWAQSMPV